VQVLCATDNRPIHYGDCKSRSAEVSSQSTRIPIILTCPRPQSFRLISKNVHANSFVYSPPPSLASIYLDSGGLVVNIQEGVRRPQAYYPNIVLKYLQDIIDCLEVNYESMQSIELSGSGNSISEAPEYNTHTSRVLSEIETTLHVLILLSSPPLKGLDPVLDPDPVPDARHRVTFEISTEDQANFKATLQARGIVLFFLLYVL
jgi:hypothetical protein